MPDRLGMYVDIDWMNHLVEIWFLFCSWPDLTGSHSRKYKNAQIPLNQKHAFTNNINGILRARITLEWFLVFSDLYFLEIKCDSKLTYENNPRLPVFREISGRQTMGHCPRDGK